MIPKIIHYTWFSGEHFPELIQQCIASWHKYMPEYEYVLWDKLRLDIEFPNGYPVWLEESLSAKKWAFASDYMRAYAVYKYGGIYLDTDCMAYHSFDDLLGNQMFIGRENMQYVTFDDGVQYFLTSHCFGAKAGHKFLRQTIDYYETRHFIACDSVNLPEDLRYNMLMMPYIQSRIAEMYGYKPAIYASDAQQLSCDVTIYPRCYFGFCGQSENVPQDQYVRHLGQGSWRSSGFKKKEDQENHVDDIRYKIRWRIVALIRLIAKKFGYVLIRIDPSYYA